MNELDFDVLLSFAGPERSYARAMYDIAEANGVHVFLDEEFQHEVWGKNLVEFLTATYRDRGRFCVALISEAYCQGGFTTVERRATFDRAMMEASEYLLTVRIDNTVREVVALSSAYYDLLTT